VASSGGSSTTFHLYTHSAGNCDGEESPDHRLLVNYVYPADLYGRNINGGAVGSTIDLQARMYFLREGETKKKVTLPCGECDKIVGTRGYTIDNQFRAAKVTFGGKDGKSLGDGIFQYKDFELQPGVNNIAITGTATAATNIQVTEIGCSGDTLICNTTLQPLTRTTTVWMQVYGVTIQTPDKLIIPVDESGYTKADTAITYTIAPAEYQAATAYVVILRDGNPMWYIPGKTQGTDTVTLARGCWFDIESDYEMEVVLNAGSGVEIKSAKIPVKPVCFHIVKPEEDEEIRIKNDYKGDPKMPSLTAEVELKGKDISLENPVYWKLKVEYIVNIPSPNSARSRKGLECNEQGVCKGTDGFLIPVPDPEDPSKDWIEMDGLTYEIDWGENFGGGRGVRFELCGGPSGPSTVGPPTSYTPSGSFDRIIFLRFNVRPSTTKVPSPIA